jgi:hypothetical protein
VYTLTPVEVDEEEERGVNEFAGSNSGRYRC